MPSFERSRSFIFYDGPSELNPAEEVIGIIQLTGSQSSKTEGMIQSWVFPKSIMKLADEWKPGKDVKRRKKSMPSPCKSMLDQGLDSACCHTCPLRGKVSGGSGECYCHGQVLMFGANMMLKAMSKNGWPRIDFETLVAELDAARGHGKILRNTAYGEPMCLPDFLLMCLIGIPGTAYTHAWDIIPRHRAETFQRYFMASVSTPEAEQRAMDQGWRCFVIQDEETYSINKRTQFPCPASAEMGRRTSCGSCKACDGRRSSHWKNPVIINHSRERNLIKASKVKAAKKLEMSLRII